MNALDTIAKALDRMMEIMQEPAVMEMRGLAYNDNEVALLKGAVDSLARIEPDSDTHAASVMNRKHMADVFKAVQKAHDMFDRVGFIDVKGEAWLERDKRIVDAGYEVAQQLVGRGR